MNLKKVFIKKVLKMLNRWIFILGMCVSGCASFYKAPGLYFTPPELAAYSNAYLEYKHQYLGIDQVDYPIEISFSHLEGDVIGQCQRASLPITRFIQVDYTYWQSATDDQRLLLMFHELAHCDLDCDHQEDVLGIMNARMSLYKLNNEDIEDMFRECK